MKTAAPTDHPQQTQNAALDPVWAAVPGGDRYTLDGRRYVLVWHGPMGRRRGALVPLADYAELIAGRV